MRNDEPSLAEMTNKAIDTLSKDKDGFFLFVEGSKVDWAAHANDPIGIISDVLAFDDAVNEALEFAKKDGNTMVIAVSDHGNSGITMGNVNTNGNYPEIPVSAYIDPLKKATMTVEGALKQLNDDRSNMKEVAELYGLDNLTEEEIEALKTSKSYRQICHTCFQSVQTLDSLQADIQVKMSSFTRMVHQNHTDWSIILTLQNQWHPS